MCFVKKIFEIYGDLLIGRCDFFLSPDDDCIYFVFAANAFRETLRSYLRGTDGVSFFSQFTKTRRVHYFPTLLYRRSRLSTCTSSTPYFQSYTYCCGTQYTNTHETFGISFGTYNGHVSYVFFNSPSLRSNVPNR